LNLIPIAAFKSKAKPKENETQFNNPNNSNNTNTNNNNSNFNPINNNSYVSSNNNNNNQQQQQSKKSNFSSFLLSVYDDIHNIFIALCVLDDVSNNIPLEISENLAKNLITFYPKNYHIPIYIKPDFLFKPLEIWEVEFEEIIDSDLFLTNNDLDYESLHGENKHYTNENQKMNLKFNLNQKSFKEDESIFFMGKTLKSARFAGKKQNLDINAVTTLTSFKNIYAEYFKDNSTNDE